MACTTSGKALLKLATSPQISSANGSLGRIFEKPAMTTATSAAPNHAAMIFNTSVV
jgi:hypothetical protein